jgi:hypothetical protein
MAVNPAFVTQLGVGTIEGLDGLARAVGYEFDSLAERTETAIRDVVLATQQAVTRLDDEHTPFVVDAAPDTDTQTEDGVFGERRVYTDGTKLRTFEKLMDTSEDVKWVERLSSPIEELTQNSILFVDAQGQMAQDNTNLNFDDSTNILTVGGSISTPSITLSGLTASRLTQTDGSKALSSVSDLTAWIAGGDGMTSTSDGDGTLTLAADLNTTNLQFTANEINTIQDIDTTASPTLVAATFSGLTASRLMASDGSKLTSSVSDLTAWIAGTAEQIDVTDDSDGTITLSFDTDYDGLTAFFQGAILESAAVSAASDGATITFSAEQSGGGDMTPVFSDGFYDWDTSPADTVSLTAGSDTSPTENYVYLLQSNKTLTANTTGWPSAEHAPLATVVCQSAASLQAQGAYKFHAWTDHISDSNSMGHLANINYWIRQQHATWASGVVLTPDVAAGAFEVATTSGVVLQLHPHAFPAIDTAASGLVYVVNDSVAAYDPVATLTGNLTDALGVSMSGKHYSLVIWGVVSEASGDCKLMANLPNGSYNNSSSAIADTANYDVFDIPSVFRGCGFLIARLTMKHNMGGGGTWTVTQNEDLRDQKPSVSAGGAGGLLVTSFADNAFRVFDDGDSSKILAFEVSGLTTATTRTLTIPDEDGTIITTANTSWVDLTDSGDTTLHGHDHDALTGFVADEHVAHSGVTLTAGTGLTGGGTIAASRSFAVTGVLEDLDTLGANSADSEFLVGTGAGALAWESGATARTSLGVVIGTDVQAFGALLDDLNTLGANSADSEFMVGTGAGALAWESGTTVRTSLGLGTGNTPQFTGLILTSTLDLNGANIIDGGVIFMREQATADGDITGEGQIWVKTATPNQLWFTNDAGTDQEIVYAGGAYHDGMSDFAANEHIDHTSVTLTASTGLTGGGDISGNRSFAVTGVLEDIVTAGVNSADSEFLVGTGAGALAWETGTTARSSLGVGTGDTPQFTGLILTGLLDMNGGDIDDIGVMFLREQAAAEIDSTGEGQIWVKTATPNQLWFTNDAGTDQEIVYAGGAYHDGFSDFVADEHVAHGGVTMTAGAGLTGGGTIAATRTFNVDYTAVTAFDALLDDISDLTDPGADRLLFWDDGSSIMQWLTVSTGLSLTTTNLTTNDGAIVHDNLSGFVANEHIDHTAVTLTAGTGLTGGGDISATRSFAVDGVLEDLDTLGAAASDGQIIVATGAGAFAYESGATALTSLGAQAQGDVLDDLNTLGANSGDSEFLVGTGAGALAWENAATAATSMGLGTGDSPTWVSITATGNADIEGYGAIGNGSALSANSTWLVDRDFNATGGASQIRVRGIVTATSGTGNITHVLIDPDSSVINSGNAHSHVSSLYVDEPVITETSGSATTATTVYIQRAPTEGGVNYSLFVDAGFSRFDDAIYFTRRTGDPAASGNRSAIYSKDVSASAEVFVMDEGGTASQISPHNPLTGERWLHEYSTHTNKTRVWHLERILRMLEAKYPRDMEDMYEELDGELADVRLMATHIVAKERSVPMPVSLVEDMD